MDLRVMAISRLMLDNFPHIKAYWVMLGIKTAQVALSFGADDIDGTVVHEKIYHDAGSDSPQELTVAELRRLIEEAGRVPVERDTLYHEVVRANRPVECRPVDQLGTGQRVRKSPDAVRSRASDGDGSRRSATTPIVNGRDAWGLSATEADSLVAMHRTAPLTRRSPHATIARLAPSPTGALHLGQRPQLSHRLALGPVANGRSFSASKTSIRLASNPRRFSKSSTTSAGSGSIGTANRSCRRRGCRSTRRPSTN